MNGAVLGDTRDLKFIPGCGPGLLSDQWKVFSLCVPLFSYLMIQGVTQYLIAGHLHEENDGVFMQSLIFIC